MLRNIHKIKSFFKTITNKNFSLSHKSFETLFFLLPAIIMITIFYILPVILSIYISFTPLKNWNIDRYIGEIVGFRNYEKLFYMFNHDPSFKAIILTTIVFIAVTLTINVLGGLALSLATFFIYEKPSAVIRTLWLLPRMSPIAVYSLVWYYFFHGSEIGTLNSFLMSIGLIDKPVSWGQEVIPWGPWSIIIFVNGLVGVSFGMIVFTSAISNIPKELVIAARVDGASNWEISRKILIPLMKWHILYVTTWQLLSLLTTYAHLFLLVEWGLVREEYGTTLSLYVYRAAFTGVKDQGLAAAAGVILVIIGSILGLITLKILRFGEMVTEPRGDV